MIITGGGIEDDVTTDLSMQRLPYEEIAPEPWKQMTGSFNGTLNSDEPLCWRLCCTGTGDIE